MTTFRTLVVVLLSLFINYGDSLSLGSNCPQFCVCDLDSFILNIQCFQAQSNAYFNMPDLAFDPDLEFTKSIVVKYSFLQTYPNYICQYSKNLFHLDLSSNNIVEKLTSTNFNCLQDLISLNLSTNYIKFIEEDSFNRLNSLVILDLSNNRLDMIQPYLFYKKLPQLQYLYLQNNTIVELDPWYFFFQRIRYIDLSFNKISKFTNYVGWSASSFNDSIVLRNADLIDLRYNILNKFDDSVLHTYFLCSPTELSVFFSFMYRLRIDANPLTCSCDSYHLLSFFSTLSKLNKIDISSNLFRAICAAPTKYFGRSIFDFEDTAACFGSAALAPIGNCITFTMYTIGTTVANLKDVTNNLILSDSVHNVPDMLTNAQIAGIIIGFVAFITMNLLMIYALFRIEINALAFHYVPAFYKICPCKKFDVSNKCYDVFVAHNISSNEWIEDKLIPYFRLDKPVNKFFLQYSQKNANSEVISPYLKKIMENSSCILMVLSEGFILHEWANKEFRDHVRDLVINEKARLVCVQLNDISDEEVDDYIRNSLQVPYFVSLESDEFLFWRKLTYFLYSNREDDNLKVKYPSHHQSSLPALPELRAKRKILDESSIVAQQQSKDDHLCLPDLFMSKIEQCIRNGNTNTIKTKTSLKFNKNNRVDAPLVHIQSNSSDTDNGKYCTWLGASNREKPKLFHLSKPKSNLKVVKRLDANNRKIDDSYFGVNKTAIESSSESQFAKPFRLKGCPLKKLARFFKQNRPPIRKKETSPSRLIHDEYNNAFTSSSQIKSVQTISDLYFNYNDLKDLNEEPNYVISRPEVPSVILECRNSSMFRRSKQQQSQQSPPQQRKVKRRISFKAKNENDQSMSVDIDTTRNLNYYMNLPKPSQNIYSEDSA